MRLGVMVDRLVFGNPVVLMHILGCLRVVRGVLVVSRLLLLLCGNRLRLLRSMDRKPDADAGCEHDNGYGDCNCRDADVAGRLAVVA